MDFSPRKVSHTTSVVEVKMSQNDVPDILWLESQLGDLPNCSFIQLTRDSVHPGKQTHMTAWGSVVPGSEACVNQREATISLE
jgi:hypothetical protein